MAKARALPDNHDLQVTEAGAVVREDEAKAKTTPNLRVETDTDSSGTFEADYTVRVDDADNVPQVLLDRQYIDVRTLAVNRGLKPTGAPKLEQQIKVDGRNVRLIYALPVELNGSLLPKVAVSPQPDDTEADVVEKLPPATRKTKEK